MEVFGARRGVRGILNGQFHKMRESDVGQILGKGGSVFGSTGYRIDYQETETIAKLAKSLEKFSLVVVTGGIGSFALFNKLYASHDMGLTTTMFIPASVENEFLNPLHTNSVDKGVHAESVGSDTAANTAIQAIDRLREQSFLSRTVFLVEGVGLKSNYLPIQIGSACGAHRVYLPKFPLISRKCQDGNSCSLR